MKKEYWFPIGEDIKKQRFWQENKMSIKQLDRKGFCGHCTRIIYPKSEYVLTYKDQHNQMPRVIICQECIKELITLFNNFNKATHQHEDKGE